MCNYTFSNKNLTKLKIKTTPLLAAALVFTGSVLFSVKAVLVKLAYQCEVDTLSLLTLRMSFALPFYLAIAWSSHFKPVREKTLAPLSRQDLLGVAAFGILGYFAASFLDFWGLQYISAGMERLILFIYPTIVLLLNAVLFKEKINRTQIIALVLSYLGVSLAFIEGISLAGHKNFAFGGFLIFCCALTYAVYLVGSGRMVPRLGTSRFTSLAMIFACSVVIIQHGIMQQWQLFDFATPVYFYAFLMAIFATVIPTLLISEGIRIIGASNASVISSIGPISTIILAYIFLGETLGSWQWLGTVLVISGVLVISLQKHKGAGKKI